MVSKVLSLLEACFDLISGSSRHIKIQIMNRKITENLGFKSPLRKVKEFLSFFLFNFKFSIKHCISLFLTIFEYLVLQIRYISINQRFSTRLFDFLLIKQVVKIKDIHFSEKNLKMKRKKNKKI